MACFPYPLKHKVLSVHLQSILYVIAVAGVSACWFVKAHDRQKLMCLKAQKLIHNGTNLLPCSQSLMNYEANVCGMQIAGGRLEQLNQSFVIVQSKSYM